MSARLRNWALRIDGGMEWVDKVVAHTWWLLIAGALFVSWEVVMRYFFNSPHDWFDELLILVVTVAAFLGCGAAANEQRHIALPVIYGRLKGRARRIADIINATAGVGICVFLVVWLIRWAAFLNQVGTRYNSDLGSPFSLIVYAIAAGMVLNAIFNSRILLRMYLGITAEDIASAGAK